MAFRKSGLKQRISELELTTVQFLLALFSIFLFFLGFWFGTSNFDSEKANINNAERLKILFPISGTLTTVAFLFFFNNYIAGKIERLKRDYGDKYERRRIELERQVNDERRLKQDLEFLFLISQVTNCSLENIDCRGFSQAVQELKIQSQLVNKIAAYKQELENREAALEGLSLGFSEDDKPFLKLVGEACNHALGIKTNQAQQWAVPFYMDIYAYLRAWLFCSIKYGTIIPIEPFIQPVLIGQTSGVYRGRETYVCAIEYIQGVALKDKKIESFLPTQGSREVVSSYLRDLIKLLRATETIEQFTNSDEERSNNPHTRQSPDHS